MSSANEIIRDVLDVHGRLPVAMSTLKDDDDLYQNGLSSHASVNVMLALEDAFDIEFPDSLLRKSTFESVAEIRNALESLGVNFSSDGA
jgi:acyl carrier protein